MKTQLKNWRKAMQHFKKRNVGVTGEGGFTLLELMIALSILALGLLVAVFPMQITAIHANSIAYQKFTASQIAYQFLDNIYLLYPKASDWTNIDEGYLNDPENGCTTVNVGNTPDTWNHYHKVFRNGVEYTLVWRVTMGAVANLNLANVGVQVFWEPLGSGGSLLKETGETQNAPCLFLQVNSIKSISLAAL